MRKLSRLPILAAVLGRHLFYAQVLNRCKLGKVTGKKGKTARVKKQSAKVGMVLAPGVR